MKSTDRRVEMAKVLYNTGDYTQSEIARALNLSPSVVCYNVNSKVRAHKRAYNKEYYANK